MMPSSNWHIDFARPLWISIDKSDVPALNSKLQEWNEKNPDGGVWRIHWGDLLMYHGDEGGWCLDDTLLGQEVEPGITVEACLEAIRQKESVSDTSSFYLRIIQ